MLLEFYRVDGNRYVTFILEDIGRVVPTRPSPTGANMGSPDQGSWHIGDQ
jgi:hypothetical protein